MSESNIFSQLNTMGFGRSKQEAPPDPSNEKESAQIVVDAAGEKISGVASKLLGVPNLSQIGQVSITQPIEYKGWADSKIPSLVDRLNANGGIIAQIAHTLVKNGVIQDHTQFHNMIANAGGPDVLAANSGQFSSPAPNDATGPVADDRGGGIGSAP